jgi:hypothetical protein
MILEILFIDVISQKDHEGVINLWNFPISNSTKLW